MKVGDLGFSLMTNMSWWIGCSPTSIRRFGFNAKTPSADAIFAYATKLAHEVGLVFSSSVSLGGALGQIVKWKHPPEGISMSGFMINIGVMNSLKAELWGIQQVLLLAKERRFSPLIVELDVPMVVHFLKSTMIDSYPCYILAKDCLELIKGD
ncbi:hypothetical protein GOBAR_AA09930 [Gossypium barbadense]|uniref:RNase H type-1 domain-containing protein n=1 Tax=Gossypium barbadense TaxID=3634 RepID=A0A2P5Y552_GOSBA|nr:hypothetical protein GOBAR_AA09930 [Gossypium barbadense]